ncbi:MAG: UDP-N-acetylenolpyruvoylglucosamine reductase [Candidatus Pelagibacter sp. TMED64]|nr:UDP-N-acetylenolpyruvoylglucosamine reductase [Candidatus Pelagibacter sp.]OUU67301.1 MAG: UDP-N-acetylenolpyruvoylglucosamine reductase [Candidatus Pelagibacter sp. TMED64]
MSLNKKIEKIKDLIEGKLIYDYNLSKSSWFNIGGNAKIFFKPENIKELSLFIKTIANELPIYVIGRGSNLLIRDGGFDGAVIKLGKSFSHLSLFSENTLIAGASALDKTVSKFAYDNSISGFEFLSCIPGSIGGAIRMNSGCYKEDMSQKILSIQAMDINGIVTTIPSTKVNFFYRGCDLSEDLIFLSVTLKGNIKQKKEINEKMKKFINDKEKSQPNKIKTCGSTFKNPNEKNNKKAWELIKFAKCDNFKVGGAKISEQHCNFFLNDGSAKAKDLESLINKVKKEVFEKTGVNLEPELKIIGNE